MIPTQFNKYTPHTKQSMFNYYLISQIDYLPGGNQSHISKISIKKGGKKTFNKNSFEESKNNFSRNINNKYFNKTGKYTKVYEFDNPIISHRDMTRNYNNLQISFLLIFFNAVAYFKYKSKIMKTNKQINFFLTSITKILIFKF